MVQPIEKLTPRRRRTRAVRTRRYLEAASRVVFTEGLDALTMQRVAKELDCAVGTIYRYFPSKDALVAELQREAIEKLLGSYRTARPSWDAHIAAYGLEPAAAALARLLVFSEWFIQTPDAYPEEFHLLRLLLGDPRRIVPGEEAQRILPSTMGLVDTVRTLVATATETGGLADGAAMQRAVVWVVSLSGALGVEKLSRFDPTVFDGRKLARVANVDLLRGWGADAAQLGPAANCIADLAALGPLTPRGLDASQRLIT